MKHCKRVYVVLDIGHATLMHLLYCHLWTVWFYSIFPHYNINGMNFGGGEATEHKMCFDFSEQILSETLLIVRIIQRDNYNKCTKVFT